jgi:hypothetical protein
MARKAKKRTKKTAKRAKSRKKATKRVTVAKSTLDKLISEGASHHAALKRLRRTAAPLRKKSRRK